MGRVRIALAAAAAGAVVTACSGTAAPQAVPASYYVALGDSLSQGVQPDAAGVSVETGGRRPNGCCRITVVLQGSNGTTGHCGTVR